MLEAQMSFENATPYNERLAQASSHGESENVWWRGLHKIALHFLYMLCARAQITILSLAPVVP